MTHRDSAPDLPVAVAIFCKTPAAGLSKTRLSPPLRPEECSALSACFISDLAVTVDAACAHGNGAPFAAYTPAGTEVKLRDLLPPRFQLLLQCDGTFGERLFAVVSQLLRIGHRGAILLNADSPTLPLPILRSAIETVRSRDCVVLGPSIDGGYTLIGLSRAHARLFEDIPWSTPDVHRLTSERASQIGLPIVNLPCWYDVDDAHSLKLLEAELAGKRLPFAELALAGAPAAATRRFLQSRQAATREAVSW
jgi:rSAM/selenodomain-associated transferase 1